MLDRTDLEPLFFAPFVSSVMCVEPAWIDYNGHLREVHEGDPVRVTFQLLDYDSKRIHYFQQLFHATDGWVSATSENMTLHVDMAAKKVAPFPEKVTRTLSRMKAAHVRLPRPEAAGRRIAMPEKA
jgi:acyl-CoA thioester hydrolase